MLTIKSMGHVLVSFFATPTSLKRCVDGTADIAERIYRVTLMENAYALHSFHARFSFWVSVKNFLFGLIEFVLNSDLMQ